MIPAARPNKKSFGVIHQIKPFTLCNFQNLHRPTDGSGWFVDVNLEGWKVQFGNGKLVQNNSDLWYVFQNNSLLRDYGTQPWWAWKDKGYDTVFLLDDRPKPVSYRDEVCCNGTGLGLWMQSLARGFICSYR